jgi:hypothetical protein
VRSMYMLKRPAGIMEPRQSMQLKNNWLSSGGSNLDSLSSDCPTVVWAAASEIVPLLRETCHLVTVPWGRIQSQKKKPVRLVRVSILIQLIISYTKLKSF